MNRSIILQTVIVAFGAATLIGCSNDVSRPQPLSSILTPTQTQAQAVPSIPGSYDSRRSAADDRPGLLPTGERRGDLLSGESTGTPISAPSVTGVSPVVRDAVRSPRDEAVQRAGLGASATTVPSGISTTNPSANGIGAGQYLQLGSVVVEVNGTPIFANKIIESIAPVLSARAKEVDQSRFKSVAEDEIKKQLRYLVVDELEFATADRNLEKNDKELARRLTAMTRDDAIRRAGGSEQLARQNAAAQGVDFDDWISHDTYRLKLRSVFYQKKELPKIQISADDMRRYYEQHLKDTFTTRSAAQFRVIKIGIKQTGSRDAALKKAGEIHDRAARGDDFAELAGATNDDSFLMKNHGDMTGNGGWMDRGAYANQKVEDAVWSINPGEVTGVLETSDAFYIAKLEQKRDGRTQSFDEEAVQRRIHDTLQSEQFATLRKQAQEMLLKDAIIYPDPPMIEPAVEMAMQMYSVWTKPR